MTNITNMLKALSDETRLRIINILYEKELCVCDIMEILKMNQTKVSRHLSYLKNADLVIDRKQAQWAYYSLVSIEEIHFISQLVEKSLRTQEFYQSDLVRLDEWLKIKNINCD